MSGWASTYIEKLRNGETVRFHPIGNSMSPKIKSGQLVIVRPYVCDEPLTKGTVVLCTVRGRQYLHKITRVVMDGGYIIGNNKGRENGCTRKIHGVLVQVVD